MGMRNLYKWLGISQLLFSVTWCSFSYRPPAYLDVKITQENETIQTTLYRKPTAKLEIVQSTTNTPKNYKVSTLNTYIKRAIYICSTSELLDDGLKFIEKIGL